MSQNLTVSLVATALQKLEVIQHSDAEVLSDDKCRARAEEVAKAALEAIAICTKYLISGNGEARIDGIGNFDVQHDHIRFAPDDDMVQYALLKQQKPEHQQRALRNALVKSLSVARAIIPALHLASGEHEQDVVGVDTPEEQLLKAIFGGPPRTGLEQPSLNSLIRSLTSCARLGSELKHPLQAWINPRKWKWEGLSGLKVLI